MYIYTLFVQQCKLFFRKTQTLNVTRIANFFLRFAILHTYMSVKYYERKKLKKKKKRKVLKKTNISKNKNFS